MNRDTGTQNCGGHSDQKMNIKAWLSKYLQHLDLGEMIDLFCMTVFPISCVVTTKRTPPKVSYWNFNIWFPLFSMPSCCWCLWQPWSRKHYITIRRRTLHRMHLLVPSEDTAGPTIYSVDDGKQKAEEEMINPITAFEEAGQESVGPSTGVPE